MDLSAAPSGPTALNSSGQVAGLYFNYTTQVNRAFFWSNGALTELGTLGGPLSFGYGVNSSGQVVGLSSLPTPTQRAFIWQSGVMTNLGDPTGDSNLYSAAFAINTAGDVAGYENQPGGVHPIIWKGGTHAGATVLSSLACQLTFCAAQVLALNDAGQAAGFGTGPFVTGPAGSYYATQAVMWDANGQATGLGSLGNYVNDHANAINSQGAVVGYSQINSSMIHAVLWQNGSMTDLGAIPGIDPLFGPNANITDNSSGAWGVNSKGQIVGISAYGTGAVTQGNGGRAFLYTNGTMYDLLSLVPGTNWKLLKAAWAINDNGQIVGVGIDPTTNTDHGFLLTPIITPTTTSVSASVNPSVFGQSVSFTATVTPAPPNANAVNDTVTFKDGNTTLGSGTYNGNGTWIFNTALSVGNHTITASYSGDNNYGSSTSPVLTQTVTQAATATTLAVAPNPANFGQSVMLTATVTAVAPGAGTPTGTPPATGVTFYDGATALGMAGLNSAATATFSTSSLTTGNHNLTASYTGDANFTGSAISSASPVTLTVNPPLATHFTVSGPTSVIAGSAFAFTVTALDQFNNTAKSYTGTVQFTSTDSQAVLPGIYTFTAADNGTHSFSATLNAAGNQTITATDMANATITGTSNAVAVGAPPPPPSAPVQVLVNESIKVTDTESFPDVFDPENVKVADAVWVTPLIQVSAPVAEFSAGSLGFSGQSGSQTVTVSDIGLGSLTLASATISGSPQFAISQIACSNSASSFSTTLPSGGVCTLTIGYTASATPANDNGTLSFADNAALSNILSVPAGPSYTQSLAFSGGGSTIAPPPPPPAVIPVMDNETIYVTDTESFPDVVDAELIHVTDTITLTVLNTSVGTNLTVRPIDSTTGSTPVSVTYGGVTRAGITSLTTSSTGPAAPTGFQPGVPPVYYNLSTSATFAGTATVCINYAGTTFANPSGPQLFHYQNGSWVNITTSVNTTSFVACGVTASFSPFALFAPLPVLTITANSFSRQYGAADPTFTVLYSGFVNSDTPASLSGTLTCLSTDTVASPVGTYAINCSGLSSPNYVTRYAPGVLTVAPAPLTVTAGNAQKVYGAAIPVLTGTITGIQNGDNISATYATAATPASPVGTYAIAPTLVDPTGKLGNYKVTLINGTLTVIQASTTTTLSVSPNPSNFGQSVTLTATVAPIAPGAGTATGKVTFFDGTASLGTITLNRADIATFTTSSPAAGSHSFTASYSGDSNFSASSSSTVSDQVLCGVLISLLPSTVPVGGTITVTGKVISCATTTQTVVVKFTLSGPSQPNSCSSTKSVMFTTPPFPLPPKTSQAVSFPFKVPSSGVCPGTYSITAATLVNGVAVDTSTAPLTITAH
jgi:probable HAF family extracellular repeat protein